MVTVSGNEARDWRGIRIAINQTDLDAVYEAAANQSERPC
jgi:hypothetical protein